ncbi:MAG: hypothetical protein OXJ53_10805 [Gammaproteobacteria bacterium]|nr:hypothetical protein [Gammaproteobacteria bacterium]MDE0270654.1 hypothetical protein [Gammaproteobacteria bacterium]
MRIPTSAFTVCLALALAACVSESVRTVDMTPPKQFSGVQDEALLLDVGVAVLDPNIPETFDEQVEQLVNPDIRRAEAQFMPYFAKNLLQSTGNWGAVRVVPRATHAVDVTVTGKILQSDGERLNQEFTVTDARGVVWFTKTYRAEASKYAYSPTVPPDIDPFQANYKQLADDMLTYRESLDEATVRTIRATAEMKFARDFSPDAFDAHVRSGPDGGFELLRLPAEDDPMLARVRRVREREYVFIDTLDEHYANYHRQMYGAYQNWRAATYSEAASLRELKAQARTRTWAGVAAIGAGIGGIYESDNPFIDATGLVAIGAGAALIKNAVAKRNEAAMQAEALQELGVAAEAEIMPHTMELENETVRLQGTVDEQYEELRKILRQLYFEDLGLPTPPAPEAPEANI